MSHFSGVWAEAEKIFYLLTDGRCPIYFLNNAHAYDAAKWLASKGVVISNAPEPPKEEKPMIMCTKEARRVCPYAYLMCRSRHPVEDDSECAAFIREVMKREKQTPKACTHQATLYNALTCPSCLNVVSNREKLGNNYTNAIPNECPYCGQRLKVPEEESV